MKGLLIVQYYPYQYFDQFKPFIEKLGLDWDYRYDIRISTSVPRNSFAFTKNGKVIQVPFSNEKFFEDYDYIIYTGQASSAIETLASYTRRKRVYYIPHSLVGTNYDVKIALSKSPYAIGLIPECWSHFESYRHIVDKFTKDNGASPNIRLTKTHPILLKVYEDYPRQSLSNSIGAIFGHINPFESYKKDLDEFSSIHHIENINVRMHMLSDCHYNEYFSDSRYTRSDPFSESKYDFTDKCKYLVGAPSSLLIEAFLRNKKWNRGQEIYKFPDQRGLISPFKSITGNDKSATYDETVYDDFVCSVDDVLYEFESIIEEDLG